MRRKQKIRLSESQLKRVVASAVKRVLNESFNEGEMVASRVRSMLSPEAMESLQEYNDMYLLDGSVYDMLMNGGEGSAENSGHDLYFSYKDGVLTLECESGMCELGSVRCDVHDAQQLARACAQLINNGVTNY